jgi:CMP-N-acetylneuraminic acid synthetase
MSRKFAETKYFEDMTLLDVAIRNIVQSKTIVYGADGKSNFYVATGDRELIDCVKKYEYSGFVNLFMRSEASLNSEGDDLNILFEWAKELEKKYEYVIMLNACCPIISPETIKAFVDYFINSCINESLFAVTEKKNKFWSSDGTPIVLSNRKILNTKYEKPILEAANTLYASRLDWIIKENKWLGDFINKDNPEVYTIKEVEAFDIDYEWQFVAAQELYRRYRDGR